MPFDISENMIVYKEDGKVLGEVVYPPAGINLVDICRTYVDKSLRGQGMAARLMEQAAREIRKTGRRAVVTCSYAVEWFEENPDYADVLQAKKG